MGEQEELGQWGLVQWHCQWGRSLPTALPNPGGGKRGEKQGRESKPMNNRLLRSIELESAYTGEGKSA